MKKMDKNEEYDYLCKRAKAFNGFLLDHDIYPESTEIIANDIKELEKVIATKSLQKIRNYNKVIDIQLIREGENFTKEKKLECLKYFEQILDESQNQLIEQKLSQYHSIIKKGIIKSNLEINDAIEIANSDILGLTEDEKRELKSIVSKSMSNRIDAFMERYK